MFIHLKDSGQSKIVVNSKQIQAIWEYAGRTHIQFANENTIAVIESLDQVLSMIPME